MLTFIQLYFLSPHQEGNKQWINFMLQSVDMIVHQGLLYQFHKDSNTDEEIVEEIEDILEFSLLYNLPLVYLGQ